MLLPRVSRVRNPTRIFTSGLSLLQQTHTPMTFGHSHELLVVPLQGFGGFLPFPNSKTSKCRGSRFRSQLPVGGSFPENYFSVSSRNHSFAIGAPRKAPDWRPISPDRRTYLKYQRSPSLLGRSAPADAHTPVSSLIALACLLEGVEFELPGDFLNGQSRKSVKKF